MYRGGSGCEKLWKQIDHEDITLIEQSAEHPSAEVILNARAYRRSRSGSSPSAAMAAAAAAPASATAATTPSDTTVAGDAVPGGGGSSSATLETEAVEIGGLLIKLSLPNSACCRELAQLLHGLSDKA